MALAWSIRDIYTPEDHVFRQCQGNIQGHLPAEDSWVCKSFCCDVTASSPGPQKQCHRQPGWGFSNRKVSGKYYVLCCMVRSGHMQSHILDLRSVILRIVLSSQFTIRAKWTYGAFQHIQYVKSMVPETNLQSRSGRVRSRMDTQKMWKNRRGIDMFLEMML